MEHYHFNFEHSDILSHLDAVFKKISKGITLSKDELKELKDVLGWMEI